MNGNHRNALSTVALLALVSANVISTWNDKAVVFAASHGMGPPPAERLTVVPDSELELLGVSVDHKTWEAPDGTIYQCDAGFYAIKVKGQGTIRCNGKEL